MAVAEHAEQQNDEREAGVGGRPRLLAFAYSCDPDAGSEGTAAWATVQAMLERADVTVLTKDISAPQLRRRVAADDETRVQIVPVAVPRGATPLLELKVLSKQAWHGVYIRWLQHAREVGQRLHQQRPFDVVMHVAYGTYWLPSPVVDFDVPSIWGPVGGSIRTPLRLYRFLGPRGLATELEKVLSVRLASLLPATRRTWRRVDVPVAETEQTRHALPSDVRARTIVANRAALVGAPTLPSGERRPYVMFPSRLDPRKGGRLALHALTHTPSHVELRFVNHGPQEAELRRLARRLGVADRAYFLGRIPRDELFAMESEAAAIVMPGLREEGGCALAEAMSMGVPVIVLGHAGARLVAEQHTDPNRIAIVEPGGARETARRFADAMTRFCNDPPAGTSSYIDHSHTVAQLHRALDTALTVRTA